MVATVQAAPDATKSRWGGELGAVKSVKGSITMKNLFVRFAKDESGATAIEYGLIAAGISVAIAVVVGTLGGNLEGIFDYISGKVQVPE
jgi:pilus assembly protein Flp/PilA